MADSLDKMMYSFVMEDVLKGIFIYVPPGYVACVYDLGRGVLKKVLTPGLHLKIPFWQVAKLFNAQVLEYSIHKDFDITNKEILGDLPITTSTKDGADVTVEGSILFKIDKENAPELWENIGEHFVSKVVRPFSRSKISAIFTTINADVVKNSRNQLEDALKQELNKEFQDRGLICEGVLLSEVTVKNV